MSQFARTTPSSLGMDAAGLSRFLDACRERGFDLHSIMVALDGEVVAEGWAEPYSADGIQLVYSCSKSFTALAAGLLVPTVCSTSAPRCWTTYPGQSSRQGAMPSTPSGRSSPLSTACR